MFNLLVLVKYILDSYMAVSYREKYEVRLIVLNIGKNHELRQESDRS